MKKNRIAFTLVELLVVIAIVGLLIAITIPATNKALGRAKRMQCASNLKQLAAATLMYCKDFKGEFPVLLDSANNQQWGGDIASYIGTGYDWDPAKPASDRPVFFCPQALKHHRGTFEDKHGSYAMNSGLMVDNEDDGTPRRIHQFKRTSQVVMFADGHWQSSSDEWAAGLNWNDSFFPDDYPDNPIDGRNLFVHGEGANFVFLDGHTEWLAYENYSTNGIMWQGTFLGP
jgi:prepilin-type processing-associated H-X9-DG protein/prepilin-type N-terminal cleavage/methylation domain-containing protein